MSTPQSRGAAIPRRSRSVRAALAALVVIAVAALTANWLPLPAPTTAAGPPAVPPSVAHPLGTNDIGQDLTSQLVHGARAALLVGGLGGGGALAIGVVVGLVAGWRGGAIDAALRRATDIGLALPTLPLVLLVAAYARPTHGALAAVIAVATWPPAARVVRTHARSLRGRGHIRAAHGFGAPPWHLARRHLLPDSAPVLLAAGVGAVARAISTEAGVAFLGLSTGPASWGATIRAALDAPGLFSTPLWAWWLVPPALALVVLLLALVALGVAVDDEGRRVQPRAGATTTNAVSAPPDAVAEPTARVGVGATSGTARRHPRGAGPMPNDEGRR